MGLSWEHLLLENKQHYNKKKKYIKELKELQDKAKT